jgi:hypothetical protein
LVKVGKIDDAKSFFDLMVKKLKMDVASYQFMMKVLSEAGRLDDVLQIVDMLLDDNGVDFDEEFQEFVKVELRKEGREEDLTKLMEEKERLKAEAKAKEAEAAEAAKKKIGSGFLLTSKLFGNKETESESAIATSAESSESAVATPAESSESAVATPTVSELAEADGSDEGVAKNDRASEQLTG